MFVRKIKFEPAQITRSAPPRRWLGFPLFAAIAILAFATILVCDAMGVHMAPEHGAPIIQPE